ncbi:MAG: hypothetical protein DDT30_02028 [Dehalococcoidia bacterium]|nr:hypothetical protein [Bacillota bacterium]MBT9143746.1 hypothetical protein [Bacillota bacterium]
MQEFLSFRRMLTPVIIKVVFWIGVVVCVIMGLLMIIEGIDMWGWGGEGMVLSGILVLFLGPLAVRIYCEILIVIFRILDELTMARKARWGAAIPDSKGDKEPVCPQCGTANSFADKFCQKCGTRL